MDKGINPYPLIISFITIRRIIGILSIVMPAILIAGTYIIGGCSQIQDSLSHYYYTVMRDFFVGNLCALALFLISYNGYQLRDRVATTLGGIFALLIAFFPTTQNQDAECAILLLEPNSIRVYIHYGAAILFFATFAYTSIFLFTKGPKQKGRRKKLRNRIHRTCGLFLIISIVLIALIRGVPSIGEPIMHYKPVFWIEWLALCAFGISWLVKGEMFIKDIAESFEPENATDL